MNFKKSLLIASLTVAIHGCSQKSPEEYISSAIAKIEQKDFNAAIIELKNALKEEPNNAQSRILLADIYFQQGQFAFAEKEYSHALKLESNLNQVIPNLLSTYLGLFNYEDILLFEYDEYQNLSNQTLDAIRCYQTIASIRMGDLVTLQKVPSERENQSKYAKLHQAYLESVDDRSLGLKSLQTLLEDSPKFSDALFLKGQLHSSLGEFSDAVNTWTEYKKQKPNHLITSLYLADALNQDGQLEEGYKVITQYLKNNRNNPIANQIKAFSAFELGKYEEALLAAEYAFQNGIESNGVRLLAGYAAFRTNGFEKAHKYLAPLVETLNPEHPAHRIFILTEYNLGKNQNVIEAIDDDGALDPIENQLLAASAYNLLIQSNTPAAQVAIEKLSNNTNLSPQQSYQLALLKFTTNETKSGISILEKVRSKGEQNERTEYALAKAYLKEGDIRRSSSIAEDLIKDGYIADGHLIKSEIALATKKFDTALLAIEKAISEAPDKGNYRLTKSRVLRQLNRADEAHDVLVKLLKTFPDYLQAYIDLYVLEAKENKDKSSLTILNAHLNKKGSKATEELKQLYAQLLIREGELVTAYDVISTIQTANTKNPASTFATKSNLEIRLGKYKEAEDTLKQWVDLQPVNPIARTSLISFYDNVGQINLAVDAAEQARNYITEDDTILMLNAHLLLKLNKLEEAKAIYNTTSTRSQLTDAGQQIKGNILVYEGKLEEGLQLLLETHDNLTNHFNVGLIVYTYQQLEQNNKAIEFLNTHLKSNPDDLKTRFLYANELLKNNSKNAISEYEIILQQAPNNLMALNNLAYALSTHGEVSKAESAIDKAVQIAPENINVLDTAADIKEKLGKKEESARLRDKIETLQRNNG